MQNTITKDAAIQLAMCYSKMKGDIDLNTFAISGKEGDRETYVAKITFTEIAKAFDLVPSGELPTGVMLQRELVKSRTKAIAQYIKEQKDFVFPEVIAIVENVSAKAVVGAHNIVKLVLPKKAFRYLVDGQGRLSGIKEVLTNHEGFGDMTIDIKFIVSRGIEADSQVFTDVNKTPISPNASQCIAMDSRQILSRFAREVVASTPILKDRIDFTKASVTTNMSSATIWTLSQMSKFILMLTSTTAKSAETLFESDTTQVQWKGFINTFFTQLQKNPYIAQVLSNGSGEATTGNIVGTAVFLKSLALFGRVAIMNIQAQGKSKADWSFMDDFGKIDMSVKNHEWTGRCLNYRGKFEDKSFNHKACASYLCIQTGLEVPEELETVEEEVMMARANILKQQREERKQEGQQEFAIVA